MPALVSVLLALVLLILPSPALADWCCDGDRLSLETISGGVDVRGLAGGIPNTSNGTLPGEMLGKGEPYSCIRARDKGNLSVQSNLAEVGEGEVAGDDGD
mgnify:CR=1 FL=1